MSQQLSPEERLLSPEEQLREWAAARPASHSEPFSSKGEINALVGCGVVAIAVFGVVWLFNGRSAPTESIEHSVPVATPRLDTPYVSVHAQPKAATLDSDTASKAQALLDNLDVEMAVLEGALHTNRHEAPYVADQALDMVGEIRTTCEKIRGQIRRGESRALIEAEIAKLMGLLDRANRFARTAVGSR